MKNEVIIINTDKVERPKSEMSYEAVRNTLYEKSECEKVTVVVQAYGRLDKTRLCTEHVLKFTQDVPFKLILLDNGSEEKEIMEYFKNVNYPNKTIMRLTKNITGVYATNKALQMVNTKYVVIVNNDVLVTPKWLTNLLECADSDPKIGMVCPVSTNVSCGQEENLGGFDTIDEMIERAKKYNISNSTKWEERLRLIPTVALYRRSIFEIVGLYDTGFIHDWGDDDYSFRVRHAGYKLILCRDTFVHHNHNVRKLEDKDPVEAIKLANSGRKIFQQRHHGIDSWNDTNDTISSILAKFNINRSNGNSISALGIDCKCGAMILDIKNFYRRNGIADMHTTALVNDIKYYHELQYVSEQVIWGTPDEMKEELAYDFIAIGKPLNQYENPIQIIRKAYKITEENGYILFSLINSADYRQFLYCLGNSDFREKEMPKVLYSEEVTDCISQMGGEIQEVFRVYHQVGDEMKKDIENTIQCIAQGNKDKINSLMSNLLVMRYWFIVKKTSSVKKNVKKGE